MNFDIKTEQLSAEAFVISLSGEVDLYTAPEFKQQLLEVIGQGGKEVVVDFSQHDLHRLDDTRRARRRGQAPTHERRAGCRSYAATGTFTKIFEITGLDKVFEIYATRDEAVSSLGVPQG